MPQDELTVRRAHNSTVDLIRTSLEQHTKVASLCVRIEKLEQFIAKLAQIPLTNKDGFDPKTRRATLTQAIHEARWLMQ